MEHDISDSLGSRHVLVTGAGGQLGTALAEAFPGARGLTRADWDVTFPPPPDLGDADLVLHAAAYTDVDGAEADPQTAAAVNVGGTQHAAELDAPLVYFYDAQVWNVLPTLQPSGRGELEITDVNNWYVERKQMEADVVEGFWGDAGESIAAYYEVNDFVRGLHG